MAVPDTVKAHFALALVQVNFGIYHVISKVALTSGVNQLVFCAYRDLIALAMLAPFAYLTERRTRPSLTWRTVFSLMVLGLLGIFANQLLFLLGLGFTSPAYASAMQPAIPVFTFILTLCMGTEQIRLKQWSGVAKVGGTMACVSGAVLLALYKGPVVWGDDSFNMHNQNDHSLFALHMNLWQIGILCLIGNCFCFALYVALQAPLLKIYPASSSVTAASYAFATVFIVLSAFAGLSDWNDWILSSSEIMAVVFSGIVASALNYWLLTWSNKVVGPGIVSLYMPIQPLFSSIFSRIFLGSSIYVGSVLGALFIIVGLYSVTWGQMKSRSIDHYNDPMGRDFTDDISADGSLQTSLIKGN